MKSEKFTVIIPTRERAVVLAKSLQTVLAQDYDNLEIIVSDNFSNDETCEVVHSFADPRIKYFNTGTRISMSANWELALSKVEDGWVGIIGDDDGLMPECIPDIAEMVGEHDVDAVMCNYCFYRWPSFTGKPHGDLRVPLMSGWEIRDSKAWLGKLFHGQAIYARLPMIYTGGFVHKRAIDRVIARSGRFFNSAVPDVYSAIAVSAVINRYAYIYKPQVLVGVSKFSSGSNFCRKDKDQSSLRQFLSEKNIPVHPTYDVMGPDHFVPAILGIVYESYTQAKAFFHELPEISLRDQLIRILASERKWSEELEEWAPRFASKHALGYGGIRLRARAALPSLAVRAAVRRLVGTLYYEKIDSERTPITDVAQAAQLAGEMLGQRDGLREPIAPLVHWSVG